MDLLKSANMRAPASPADSGLILVPDDHTVFRLSVPRCTTATPSIWPSKDDHISVNVFFSFDGEETWQFHSGFTSHGGIVLDEGGAEAESCEHVYPLPPGKGRRAKVTLASIFGSAPPASDVKFFTQ